MEIVRVIVSLVFLCMGVFIWMSPSPKTEGKNLGGFFYFTGGIASLITVSWWPVILCFILVHIVRYLHQPAGPQRMLKNRNNAAEYATADYAALKRLAEQGHADAQTRLGLMYHQGYKMPQDHKKAVSWYRKAAELGDAEAQYRLGLVCALGHGVPQDDKEAVKWYLKAAEQGHARAQYNLGVKYHVGKGVTQDHVQAYKWFSLAAASRHDRAAEERDLLARKMTPEQIAEAQRLESEWMEKHPQ